MKHFKIVLRYHNRQHLHYKFQALEPLILLTKVSLNYSKSQKLSNVKIYIITVNQLEDPADNSFISGTIKALLRTQHKLNLKIFIFYSQRLNFVLQVSNTFYQDLIF